MFAACSESTEKCCAQNFGQCCTMFLVLVLRNVEACSHLHWNMLYSMLQSKLKTTFPVLITRNVAACCNLHWNKLRTILEAMLKPCFRSSLLVMMQRVATSTETCCTQYRRQCCILFPVLYVPNAAACSNLHWNTLRRILQAMLRHVSSPRCPLYFNM